MAIILPNLPTLPNPPKASEEFLQWAQRLTVHLQRLYAVLAKAVVDVSRSGGGGGAPPTGTGFRHVTAGAEDAAAKLVDTADVNADQITYAKIQNVSAALRLLGRITAGAGDIEELTGTQATTLLDIFTSVLKGLVPASGGGTTSFLRADGTFAVPPGGSGAPTDADYLVGTANAGLSAEIVVGPTPGGQLGGTWASPDVRGIRESFTPTLLTFGVIADGGYLRRVGTSVTGGGVSEVIWSDFIQDLGAGKRSGTFDVATSFRTADKDVIVIQTAKAIASKGNARDEAEMDAIQATGYVVDANTIRVYWWAPSVVVGTYAFAYAMQA